MKIMPHEMPKRMAIKAKVSYRPELHSDEFLADCAEMRVTDAAEKWGCNRSTVMARRNDMAAKGIRLGNQRRTPRTTINAIVTMRNKGVKFQDIADKMGMPRSTAANIYYREAPYFSASS